MLNRVRDLADTSLGIASFEDMDLGEGHGESPLLIVTLSRSTCTISGFSCLLGRLSTSVGFTRRMDMACISMHLHTTYNTDARRHLELFRESEGIVRRDGGVTGPRHRRLVHQPLPCEARGARGCPRGASPSNRFLGELWVRKGLAALRPLTPRRRWLRGLDLNRRPLGYEPSTWAHATQRSPTTAVT